MPRKSKKTAWVITLLILLAAAGAGYYYYSSVYLPGETPAQAETLQTAKVRRGDLVVSASSAGSLVPLQKAAIGFRSSGVLAEVLVEPGDAVEAGQVLARLDDADARASLTQAEANLRLAQNKLAAADVTAAQAEANLQLAELKLNDAAKTIKQAEANLELAQLKLDTLRNPDTSALAVAQANLASAQAEMDALLAGPTEDEIAVAVVDMEQAAVAVKQAQANYDTVAWADDVQASPQAAALQTATLAFEKAAATYRQKVAEASPEQLAAAQAKLTQAQQLVNDLQAGGDVADIATAQIAIEQAQAALDAARDTAALEIGVEQAQANLSAARDTTALEIGVEQAQLTVDTAQRNLEQLSLRAPFAGIVTDVSAVVGETSGATPVVTMFDSSRAQIELYLDETDLDKLTVGNPVEVVFDALPDLTFTGQIMRINPSLVTVDGVPVISALAQLDEPDAAESAAATGSGDGQASPLPTAKLMPGMNAAVEVIAGKAENALLVPVEALRELGPGQYAVFVMDGGQPTLRPVKVGLKDITYAEILEGVEQGEEVTTGIVATE